MQKGSFVKISFTGKVKETQKIFETTSREEAEKAGIYNERKRYGPVLIGVGNQEVIKGLDDTLLEMKEGDERVVSIKPEKAFGERREENIAIIPIKEFKDRNVNPVPGLIVNINDALGKVQSVSGGRVRIDFNNELAGKEVEFKVKIEKELKTKEEKIEGIVEKYLSIIPKENLKTRVKDREIEIELPLLNNPKIIQDIWVLKNAAISALMGLDGIEKVKFTETAEKKKDDAVKSKDGSKEKDITKKTVQSKL